MTANGPLYPCNQSDSDSGSSGPDSDSIPTVPGDAGLNSNGKANYNNYTSFIDLYNTTDDCDYASGAKFWATNQLDENDDTLATHYNKYFAPACDTSQIIV
jgi:hypothetical protein